MTKMQCFINTRPLQSVRNIFSNAFFEVRSRVFACFLKTFYDFHSIDLPAHPGRNVHAGSYGGRLQPNAMIACSRAGPSRDKRPRRRRSLARS